MPEPGSGSYTLRGVGFGFGAWFATFAVGTMFHVPRFNAPSLSAALFQLALSVVWGLAFGLVMQKWDESVVLRLTGGAGKQGAKPEMGTGADAADQGAHVFSPSRQDVLVGNQDGASTQQFSEMTGELKQLNAQFEKLISQIGLAERQDCDDSERRWWQQADDPAENGHILRPLDTDDRH